MHADTRTDVNRGFLLTGFGDEISSDLAEQLDTLLAEDIHYLELRSIWDKNVLDLHPCEVDRAIDTLKSRGIAVSAIASPIGKVPIETNFDECLQRFERALEMARVFETRFVRIFSFYPPGGDPARCRDEVIRRLSIFAERAEAAGVVLLHENDREIYGESPDRCAEIIHGVNSPALRLVFDPANFVQAGFRPMAEAYSLLRDYVAYVHIKDAVLSDATIRLPGQGDGGIAQLLTALRNRGYHGFLSLEPHQVVAGRSFGFSGPGPFRDAARALKEILCDGVL